MIKDNLIEVIHEMEEVTKLFKLEPFDIYIIGGSACVLGEYTTRATLDIDFIDMGYPVINREDLFESKKTEFIKKLKIFREKYNV